MTLDDIPDNPVVKLELAFSLIREAAAAGDPDAKEALERINTELRPGGRIYRFGKEAGSFRWDTGPW